MPASPDILPADPIDRGCYHCGQKIPRHISLVVNINGDEQSMCCSGCQAVAEMIADTGLQRFYQKRAGHSINPSDLDFLQNPTSAAEMVTETYVRTTDNGLCESQLIVKGIVCAACIWLNETHIKTLPGVVSFQINYSTHRAHICWNDQHTNLQTIMQAISQIGYSAEPYDPARAEAANLEERHQALRHIGVAGFGMMQVMMLAVGLYFGEYLGIDYDSRKLLHWVSLIITTPVLLFSGKLFFENAWRGLKHANLGMDTPVSVAIALAYSASCWSTIVTDGPVYFDAITMFIFFLLLSRYFEMNARHSVSDAAELFLREVPATATRIKNGLAETIWANHLEAGDLVTISTGATVPADGVVHSGSGSVDESLLTGEHINKTKCIGDDLIGGSINLESPLIMRVEKTGAATVMSMITQLVQRVRQEQPVVEKLADKIARVFILAVLLIAGCVYLWWHDTSQALIITISVLVVTCPCALALAIPTVVTTANSAMTKQGMLPVRADVLSVLARSTDIIFDKTGTLTQGQLQNSTTELYTGYSLESCLRIAVALEQGSNHPIAKALCASAKGSTLESTLDVEISNVAQLTTIVSAGVEGVIDGITYRIGSYSFVSPSVSTQIPEDAYKADVINVFLGNQQQILARFCFQDKIRADAKKTINKLKTLGFNVHLLSGDHTSIVAAIARQLDITNVAAELSPAEKLAELNRLKQNGAVVIMVGDGINDAPVLAGADTSIALCHGAHLAQASAGILLVSEKLVAIPRSIELARKVNRIIKQNLVWALLYNISVLPLAAAGFIQPWMAVLGMSFSSLLVVGNAMRVIRH